MKSNDMDVELEEGAGPGPRLCLCVLCGLPAVGKSSLCAQISTLCAEQRMMRCSVVHYDDLIPQDAFTLLEEEEGNHGDQTQTEWKMYRHAVLRCIERFLEKPQVLTEPPESCPLNRDAWRQCVQTALASDTAGTSQTETSPLVLLLDDNFYYPSMRYEVYQLARKYSLGFCQVYLQCPVETCISRNQSRSTPLPKEVILEMEKRMVSPNPQKNSWEKNSIVLNTTESVTKADIQKLMEFILCALSSPLSPVEDHTEQKEADRLKCATSVMHQADQACRRLVSEAMKSARENQVPPERMRSLASELNESKTRFLHTMRKQFLEDLAATQEEIDVEQVVKRAVQVFDHDKNEILYRYFHK